MANVGPDRYYCRGNGSGYFGVAQWAPGASVVAGQLMRPLTVPPINISNTTGYPPGSQNQLVFIALNAGTTAGSEPTYPITKGGSVNDNGVVWIEITGQPAVNGDTTNSPTWTQNKNIAVTAGLVIFDSVSGAAQVVSTAGTTGNGAAPSFSATAGVTTADNTVTWTSLGLASGFAKWAAPFGDLLTTTGWMVGGKTLYLLVANDHTETTSTTGSLQYWLAWPYTTLPCLNILSVDPTTLALSAGAYCKVNLPTGSATTPARNFAISGCIFVYGITFEFGFAHIVYSTLSNYNGQAVFKKCTFKLVYQCCFIQDLSGPCEVIDCTFIGNGIFAQIVPGSGVLIRNPTFSGTFNTPYIFQLTPGPGATGGRIRDADLSGLSPTALVQNTTIQCSLANIYMYFERCKMPTGVPIGQSSVAIENRIYVSECKDGAGNIIDGEYSGLGAQTIALDIVRTGGANNGSPYSWKILTTVFSSWGIPFESPEIAVGNTTINSNVTVSVYGLANMAALPKSDQIWPVCDYFGNTTTQGVTVEGTVSSSLTAGSAWTADSTSVWNGNVAARQNTHAYTLGQYFSVPDNTRVFFCTSAGTSAGSEPGGYASAVDGGTVTDGGATFQAGFRFVMTLTLSAPQPKLAGFIYAMVKAALPSMSVWIDPLPTLS